MLRLCVGRCVLQTPDSTNTTKFLPSIFSTPPSLPPSPPPNPAKLLLYRTRLMRQVREAGRLQVTCLQGLNSPYIYFSPQGGGVTQETLDHQVPPGASDRLHNPICLCRALIGSYMPGLSPQQAVTILRAGTTPPPFVFHCPQQRAGTHLTSSP